MTARLKELGRDWQTRIKRFFDTPLGAEATPLEICQAVLDDIESRVEPVGRGRRVFPYNRLVVRLRPSGADRPALEAAFSTLPVRVRERLRELQCDGKGVEVKVALLKKVPAEWPAEQWFALDCYREAERQRAPDAPRTPAFQIAVVKGAASSRSYTFTEPLISIGRTPDPTDDRGQVRRNRVAFLDKIDGVTETVGRAHARLRFDPATGEYHVMDEGSSNGTSVIRNGAAIPVPPRDPRGVRVQSGDEIQVGRAVLRLTIGTPRNG